MSARQQLGLTADIPDEARAFSGNGCDSLLLVFSSSDHSAIATMKTLLCLPCDPLNLGRETLTTFADVHTHRRSEAIGPRRFYENAPDVTITRPRDATSVTIVSVEGGK